MTSIGYIALGSNLGNRLAYLKQAIDHITQASHVTIAAKSSVYVSEPMGVSNEQNAYFNAVIRIESTLTADELLSFTHHIEQALGRTHKGLYQARTIDLDIILYSEQQIASPILTIPHPRFLERNFVLQPLDEVLTSGWPSSLAALAEYLSEMPPLNVVYGPTEW